MTEIPRLHLISDRRLCSLESFPELARRAVAGGVGAVQLREKDLPGSELLDLARSLSGALDDQALLIVNERLDVALLAAADGVQLGETGLPAAEVRRLAPQFLIGRSVHDVAGAVAAAESGVDFLIAGHIYDSRSKAGEPGRGLEFLREVVAASPVPVIAVGGITPERVAEVLDAGAWGVAVLSGILAADDPEEAARRYRAALGA